MTMTPDVPAGLPFLIAAKRCEVTELEQLSHTATLAHLTAELVHSLQRERGLTNLYLSPGGATVLEPLQAQQRHGDAHALALTAAYRAAGATAAALQALGARWLNRMAYALQGLQALPALRQRTEARQWNGERATAAYIQVISALLAVVFEAAERAADPHLSRGLVALFQFMQGKEWAGQERATGCAMLASGHADAQRQQRWLHLVDAQARCFQVFADLAPPACAAQAATATQPDRHTDLVKLRQWACDLPAGHALDPGLSPRWFELCTLRMDALHTIEEQLVVALHDRCAQRLAAAKADLQHWTETEHPPALHRLGGSRPEDFFDAPPPQTQALAHEGDAGRQSRSLLELLHEQAQRLQTTEAELETVRASLNERKVIERAKGLLMAHRHLTEDEAHKLLRQTAMNQGRRLLDVAQAVLSMADVLPPTR